MAIQSATGSLVLVDIHSATPQVFWNGQKIESIVRVRVDWEADDQRVKLTVTSMPPELLTALTAAGIVIKEGN